MDDHIDIHAASQRLGISTRTARRWIKDGTLPAELRPGRYGPTYWLPVAAIDAINAQRPAPRDEGLAPVDVAALHRTLNDIREVALALWEEVRRTRQDVAALRSLLPTSQGGEQRGDELVGPRQRRDDRQAEEERRAEDTP